MSIVMFVMIQRMAMEHMEMKLAQIFSLARTYKTVEAKSYGTGNANVFGEC